MEKEKKFIKKTCSFYVSEYHLVTMLLPYIKKKVDEKAKFNTILENSIDSYMEKLISNINLNNKYKNEILQINWKSFKIYKYPEIENIFSNYQSGEKINIIITGKYSYVEMMNKNIEKWINENNIEENITINNCYDITDINYKLSDILLMHDKILNTSGEQDISETLEIELKNKTVN